MLFILALPSISSIKLKDAEVTIDPASRSLSCLCRRQMCLAAFLTPQGLLTPSQGEREREKWDLWVNLHRSRYTISNDVIHPSSRWHHMFLSLSPTVTSLRLMDVLMSFPRHWDVSVLTHRQFFGSVMQCTNSNSLKYDMKLSDDLVMREACLKTYWISLKVTSKPRLI